MVLYLDPTHPNQPTGKVKLLVLVRDFTFTFTQDGMYRWGDIDRGSRYVDQISPFQLPNGTYAALVGYTFS